LSTMNPSYENHEAVLRSLVDDFLRGHHCSEVVFVRLGQWYDDTFDARLMRLATGFGGGIAESADVCGALVGGIMLIGYLYGRTTLSESQTDCWRYSRLFHDRFSERTRRNELFPFHEGRVQPSQPQEMRGCGNEGGRDPARHSSRAARGAGRWRMRDVCGPWRPAVIRGWGIADRSRCASVRHSGCRVIVLFCRLRSARAWSWGVLRFVSRCASCGSGCRTARRTRARRF